MRAIISGGTLGDRSTRAVAWDTPRAYRIRWRSTARARRCLPRCSSSPGRANFRATSTPRNTTLLSFGRLRVGLEHVVAVQHVRTDLVRSRRCDRRAAGTASTMLPEFRKLLDDIADEPRSGEFRAGPGRERQRHRRVGESLHRPAGPRINTPLHQAPGSTAMIASTCCSDWPSFSSAKPPIRSRQPAPGCARTVPSCREQEQRHRARAKRGTATAPTAARVTNHVLY